MTGDANGPEVFDLDNGSYAVFLGQLGLEGLLVFHPSSGWAFHPQGTLAWDAYHQEVYRNHRATPSSLKELESLGIPAPPIAEHADHPGVTWQSNFATEMPLTRVPPKVRKLLRRGAMTVYLILEEDTYETSFGDGRFLYPEAAFLTHEDALRGLERRRRTEPDPAKRRWYTHSVKAVRLNPMGDTLFADLDLQLFEHVSVEDVVRLLNEL